MCGAWIAQVGAEGIDKIANLLIITIFAPEKEKLKNHDETITFFIRGIAFFGYYLFADAFFGKPDYDN